MFRGESKPSALMKTMDYVLKGLLLLLLLLLTLLFFSKKRCAANMTGWMVSGVSNSSTCRSSAKWKS